LGNNKNNSPEVVHESQITRQHPRYKIPAKMEIEGKLYKLEDWSVSGCAIEGLPDEIFNKRFAVGKMHFKFDDFETVVDNMKLEFVNRRPDGVVGCRFTEITPQQLAILNQIIASYLAGDIVTEDDIIHAVTRIITYQKKEKPKVDKKKFSLILLLIYSVVITLITFLLYVIYKRVYVIPTENAFIDANLTVVRAPSPCFIYYPKDLHIADKVKKGEILFDVYLVTGGVQKIASPIDGEIIKISALNGDFRNIAEPVLYILPPNSHPIYIKAHVLHKYLEKIRIGDIATVVSPTGEKFYAKLINVLPAQSIFKEKAKELSGNIYNQARNFDTLIFYTNYPLTKKMINKPLFITIDTFLNRIGWLSLNDNPKKVNFPLKPNPNYFKNKIKHSREDNVTIQKEDDINLIVDNEKDDNKSNYIENNNSLQKSYLQEINLSMKKENNFSKQEPIKINKKIEYCVIVRSYRYLRENNVKKFLNLFPNGIIDKFKDLHEFKIPGFKSYKEAKKFIKDKVSKYYKGAYVIKCKK
jgi:alginate biosynthesis protein Alg44